MIEELEDQDAVLFAQTVKEQWGYDFEDYAISSLKRRLLRIISLYQLKDVAHLISDLQKKRLDVYEVVRQITVNTTELFRDPTAWQCLRSEVLPKLLTMPEINIWHTACSTGEEVISMAIMLEEAGLLSKTYFYATDLNNQVLHTAQLGEYPIRNWEGYLANYLDYGSNQPLENYCVRKNDKIIFHPYLLERVTFEQFDLVQNEPPRSFDIVLCRNVLIYFNQQLQDNVIKKISRFSNPKSYLVIGSKETIMWCKSAEKYQTVSNKEKIYQLK